MNTLNAKLKKLHHREDEFNRNAALVPESDPNAAMINDRIMQLKENVERVSTKKTQL